METMFPQEVWLKHKLM